VVGARAVLRRSSRGFWVGRSSDGTALRLRKEWADRLGETKTDWLISRRPSASSPCRNSAWAYRSRVRESCGSSHSAIRSSCRSCGGGEVFFCREKSERCTKALAG